MCRYAIGTIVPDLKSETVARALRDNKLGHSWGRPEEWVFGGASYFKTEVTASIEAWAALTKVSAPHHSENHGIIERHNETYLNILKCFGNAGNWRERHAAASEAYNRCHCEAISSTKAKFSPIEMWRPGYTVTPYKIPVLRESTPKYFEHFNAQKTAQRAYQRNS